MKLETMITEAIARQLLNGFEYQNEYGVQYKDSPLQGSIRTWFSANKEDIVDEMIKRVGKTKIITKVVDVLVRDLESDNYSGKWKELVKEVSPLIADKVAQKMYEEHKKEICKD